MRVSRKTLSNWETGKALPDIKSLLRLAQLFHLSLDDLFLEESDIVKNIKKKEKTYDYQKFFTIIITVIAMTFVGYYSFDNFYSTLIFGISTGITLGIVIDAFGK